MILLIALYQMILHWFGFRLFLNLTILLSVMHKSRVITQSKFFKFLITFIGNFKNFLLSLSEI